MKKKYIFNKTNWKKFLLLTASLAACYIMTGCGENLKAFVSSQINTQIIQRIDENAAILKDLWLEGFISETTYKNNMKSLDDTSAYYSKLQEEAEYDMSKTGPLISHICIIRHTTPDYYYDFKGTYEIQGDPETDSDGVTHYPVLDIRDDLEHHVDNDTVADFYMLSFSEYLYKKVYGWSCTEDEEEWVMRSGEHDDVEALELINDQVSKETNEKFAYEVYVLSPDIVSSTGDASLDSIVALINKAIDTSRTVAEIKDISILNKYFVPAEDKDGNKVPLVDMTNSDNRIIGSSKHQYPNDIDGKNYKEEPGYDMVLYQWETVPVATVKFKEFKKENVEKLRELIGLGNKGKYVFTNDGSNRVYLMEYPVSVLSTMKDKEVNGTGEDKVTWEITDSGIGVNILTGKVIKYRASGTNSWTAEGDAIAEATDLYMTLSGASNETQSSKSSFILKGLRTIKIATGFNVDDYVKVATGRIILRDYLEATYAPGYDNGNPGEKLQAFGRKIRIMFDKWESTDFDFITSSSTLHSKQFTPIFDKNIPVAKFVDKDGNDIPGSSTLEITDFCSASELMKNTSSVQCFNRKGEAEEVIEARDDNIENISNLRTTTKVNSIVPTEMFPGNNMGKSDYLADTVEKQRFYTLATRKGLFESALFSSWIESQSSTASLDWWNKYLQENGFSYGIDHVLLNQYLTDNFKYQLTQNGVVILDLEVVHKVQEIFDKEADENRITFIRTVFVMLGWTMVVISFLLMLMWVFDTNTDIGVGLLQKVTMGHWIAIKYEEDIPGNNMNDHKYLSFGPMALRVLIIIAIGIVLIIIDVFEIVDVFISTFGDIASRMEQLIKGR